MTLASSAVQQGAHLFCFFWGALSTRHHPTMLHTHSRDCPFIHPPPFFTHLTVLLAEVISHFAPRMVELHNYSAANAMQQKLYNWQTLNRRVLPRLGLQLSKEHMQEIASGVPGAVEDALRAIKARLETLQECDGCVGGAGGVVGGTSMIVVGGCVDGVGHGDARTMRCLCKVFTLTATI